MAALPIFFYDGMFSPGLTTWLEEDTARHVVQVLRMQHGDRLQLTDGKGQVADTTITIAEKKKCSVAISQVTSYPVPQPALHLAIAFTKNTSRNEWLLEKATELGARSIIPLIATRTERERIRYDRWKSILVSAMLQSQQYHLPVLPEAMSLKQVLEQFGNVPQKLAGHCITDKPRKPLSAALSPHKETLLLIGPEGDFTSEEVDLCEAAGCAGISMGSQRLRTETAAMAACAYFNMVNHG